MILPIKAEDEADGQYDPSLIRILLKTDQSAQLPDGGQVPDEYQPPIAALSSGRGGCYICHKSIGFWGI